MKSYTILDASIPSFKNMIDYREVKSPFFVKKHYLIKEKSRVYKKGDYFTITFKDKAIVTKKDVLTNEILKVLKLLFHKYHRTGKILIVGLGNPKVLSDALGPITTDKIMATYQYDFLTIPKVAIYNPNVTANTGISSLHLLKMVVKDLEPDVILVIDSLLTKNVDSLNNTIEINDAGIIPGSLINVNKEINSKTFNIPLIAIGAPLVYECQNRVFTSVNAEECIENISNIIADALKKLLF